MLIKYLMWIPVICTVIGIIYFTFLFLYLKRKDKININKPNQQKDENTGHYLRNGESYLPIQDFMDFKTFLGNVVVFDDYNYAVILQVSSINTLDMSESEVEILESSLSTYYNSLNFYIKDITFARNIDLDKTFEHWEENVSLRSGMAKNFGLSLISNGIRSCTNTKLKKKNNYILIPYQFERNDQNKIFNNEDILDEVRNNLQVRSDTVISGLHRAGLDVKILDLDELIEFYNAAFNRDKSNYFKVREILDSGSNNVMSDFVTSRKPEPNNQILHYGEIVEKVKTDLGLNFKEDNTLV